jgi:uncharacterized protein DUF4136
VKRILIVSLLSIGLVAVVEAAKLKVQAEPDPTFDFATVHTFAFDADADVIMARTQTDDPAPIKAFVDPRIRKYVGEEMAKKGIRPAAGGTPDVYLHYYVLVTINANGQYTGQFLPSVPYWGLPPFAAGTTSLEVVTKGSLVLDALLPGAVGERKVIWRGIAQSTVEDIDADAVRDTRLRTACAELIKRFPLKKKK